MSAFATAYLIVGFLVLLIGQHGAAKADGVRATPLHVWIIGSIITPFVWPILLFRFRSTRRP